MKQEYIKKLESLNKIETLQIPDHLICKITFDLMENPVCTEAGHCYEKEVIEEHLQKNGPIDPFTRQPVSPKLYPAFNIK